MTLTPLRKFRSDEQELICRSYSSLQPGHETNIFRKCLDALSILPIQFPMCSDGTLAKVDAW